MRDCTVFSCIDIRDAYHNIGISEDSQKYLTINTDIALFVFKRLPNGVHSGPAVFQQIMDTVLAGIPKVICLLDDILCGGFDVQDQLNTLSVVLSRLQAAGFKLNKTKCKFLQSSVTYLGHVIDANGYNNHTNYTSLFTNTILATSLSVILLITELGELTTQHLLPP